MAVASLGNDCCTSRPSGISVVGNIPWGTHLCQFYQDSQDLLDVLVPYFVAGLQANEYCLWGTTDALTVDEAKAALTRILGDLTPYIRNGQLEILDSEQWYKKNGKFEAERVLKAWGDKLGAARQRGFEGMRVSASSFWLDGANWHDFVEYETIVDNAISEQPMLAICAYDLARCGLAEILDVVANHPFVLLRRNGSWQIVDSIERERIAAERDRSRIQLVQLLAHEFRSPMTALKGFAQLIGMQISDDQTRKLTDKLTEEVDRLGRMISSVLEEFRLQTGNLPMESCTLDWAEVIDSALEYHRLKGLHPLKVDLTRQVMVKGDAARLEDVVRSLLSNAAKYSRPGSPITVRLEVRTDNAVLSVRDHGAGIPAAEVDRVFERFYRASNVACIGSGGVGLALHLCKYIIERHKGKIWVESTLGSGSTFYVQLPLAPSTHSRLAE